MSQNQNFFVKGVNLPKTELGQAKFDRLVKEAESLFTAKSFFDVSVADICRAAGTAVGTFYIYFTGKTDLYRYLIAHYKHEIKHALALAIKSCTTRAQKEREGIRCFVKYAVANPTVYNIIWGCLAVEREMFVDYYVSFANSYCKALSQDPDALKNEDVTSLAYMLMGITNFLGLRAIFENMSEEEIDSTIDNAVTTVLTKGMFQS